MSSLGGAGDASDGLGLPSRTAPSRRLVAAPKHLSRPELPREDRVANCGVRKIRYRSGLRPRISFDQEKDSRGTETAMETVQQDAFAMKELLDEDGDGLTGLARTLLEAGVNEMMAARADAMCEATGTARNGFRERRLETQVGTITPGIPKLRRGTYFPDGLVERWSRVDRAVDLCAVAETCALGVSTRKVGRVLERMGPTGSPRAPSRASARRSTPRWRSSGRGSSRACASRTCGSTPPTCPAAGTGTAPPPPWSPPSPWARTA